MNSIPEILESLGYPLKRSGDFYLTKALFRDGDNPSAISIHAEKGFFTDFVTGNRGSWKQFLSLALNNDKTLIEKYSNNIGTFNNVNKINTTEYLANMQIKTYPKEILKRLLPAYDFYLNRGISKETMKMFSAGLATSAKMNNRIVFPVFDQQNNIVGFAGRLVTEQPNFSKWLILGKKMSFTFPIHLNKKIIQEKRSVMLVESVGDVVALFEAGYHNVLCTFGVQISKAIIQLLISLNVKTIYISLNNDIDKPKNVGQEASINVQKALSNFFDDVQILLPPMNEKDWGKVKQDDIKEYIKQNNL